MSTTPPEQPVAQADAGATAQHQADARATVLGWARRTIDLIPTTWLVAGVGAVLLATTAAFGGLAPAPVEPTPVIGLGDTYAGSDLEFTVVGVELRTDPGDAKVFPDEDKGEKALVVTLDVVNTFHEPRSADSGSTELTSVDGIAVKGLDAAPTLSRPDGDSAVPILQPDVPARIVAAWIVGPDFTADDGVVLTLPDSTHRVGTDLMKGDYWTDAEVGAIVEAPVVEVPAEEAGS